ncbi:MAG: LysM peptidoglycan-binding domain-containing M23 family metallopeptidase [Anaerolineales bacterium]|nr:LysM peptidoglycan-binding domain-containing M23 family metallopeptidase [Anaerolineales bacterium]
MIDKLKKSIKNNMFTILSWGVTFIVVAVLLGTALWWKGTTHTAAALVPEPTAKAEDNPSQINLPALTPLNGNGQPAIKREIELKTDIPDKRPRYDMVEYTVQRGDSIFAIASTFEVEPETVLWANFDTLHDDPHSLKPAMVLKIPPTDGIFYQWKEGDSFESVAVEFESEPEEIINWPGNDIDLTNPEIQPAAWVMVPGGSREFVQWIISTRSTGNSGTSDVAGGVCGAGGASGPIAAWPTDLHYLSGNDFWSGHLAIDLAAPEGANVYAAGSGVVTMAQGGDNYGYGNVIQIDHGNGYVTLYAHLSMIGVGLCENVYAGQWIAASGNTGNSYGAHLHFEVRLGGEFVNPWHILP